jgi:sulfur-oxidizing protein SoxY
MSVPLTADVKLPAGDSIRAVSFIVDENPSPVAAKFDMAGQRNALKLTTNIRLNQQSDVHIVVETAKGDVYVAEQLVKFAGGQASCSAPPTGDPHEIAANMGKMNFASVGERATGSHQVQRARLELNHPNHTGMVLDQITLLYIQMLMVDKIEVRQGDELVYTMTGSITLAQNPTVEFDYETNGATEMKVLATDTNGNKWEKSFPIGPAS